MKNLLTVFVGCLIGSLCGTFAGVYFAAPVVETPIPTLEQELELKPVHKTLPPGFSMLQRLGTRCGEVYYKWQIDKDSVDGIFEYRTQQEAIDNAWDYLERTEQKNSL